MKTPFDINTLISIQIDPVHLAATGGMLLSECEDEILADEFAKQTVVQMVNEGCDPNDIMGCNIGELAPITFQIPMGVVMAVSAVLVDIGDGPDSRSVAMLMRAWQPALLEIVGVLKSEGAEDASPFDRFGNCMN
jgi:hypothetical protein